MFDTTPISIRPFNQLAILPIWYAVLFDMTFAFESHAATTRKDYLFWTNQSAVQPPSIQTLWQEVVEPMSPDNFYNWSCHPSYAMVLLSNLSRVRNTTIPFIKLQITCDSSAWHYLSTWNGISWYPFAQPGQSCANCIWFKLGKVE